MPGEHSGLNPPPSAGEIGAVLGASVLGAVAVRTGLPAAGLEADPGLLIWAAALWQTAVVLGGLAYRGARSGDSARS